MYNKYQNLEQKAETLQRQVSEYTHHMNDLSNEVKKVKV
jgi:wobble nucleotide-excising tRNase